METRGNDSDVVRPHPVPLTFRSGTGRGWDDGLLPRLWIELLEAPRDAWHFAHAPKAVKFLEDSDKFVELAGFSDVGVRAEGVGFLDIGFESGRTEHGGGKEGIFFVRPKPFQDLEA